MDSTHDRYIIRGMELGCDVMTEKPMTTDEKKCRAILRAQQKTGRKRLGLTGHRELPHLSGKGQMQLLPQPRGQSQLRELYLENETYDGHFRGCCVWRPDIDIEDTMNVIVNYDTGATLSYSLNAVNGWEG